MIIVVCRTNSNMNIVLIHRPESSIAVQTPRAYTKRNCDNLTFGSRREKEQPY